MNTATIKALNFVQTAVDQVTGAIAACVFAPGPVAAGGIIAATASTTSAKDTVDAA